MLLPHLLLYERSIFTLGKKSPLRNFGLLQGHDLMRKQVTAALALGWPQVEGLLPVLDV